MRVSITQPTYLPWLGYFELIASVDVFVFLDTVQFEKQSWQNRNRLKGSDGAPFWLTVPVAGAPLATNLQFIQIAADGRKWATKHLQSIRSALGRAPYFHEIFPHLEAWLTKPEERLSEMNISGIRHFAELLGLRTRFIRASELGCTGTRTALVIDILKRVGARHYRANAGSRAYMEECAHLFAEAGITYDYQAWEHPVYPQRGDSFLSHLGFPDALCQLGLAGTSRLLGTSLHEHHSART